jgi:hypothetical protein
MVKLLLVTAIDEMFSGTACVLVSVSPSAGLVVPTGPGGNETSDALTVVWAAIGAANETHSRAASGKAIARRSRTRVNNAVFNMVPHNPGGNIPETVSAFGTHNSFMFSFAGVRQAKVHGARLPSSMHLPGVLASAGRTEERQGGMDGGDFCSSGRWPFRYGFTKEANLSEESRVWHRTKQCLPAELFLTFVCTRKL